MPVNVAVEEPRAGIVGDETNCDIIPSETDTHDIPNNGVVKVVGCVTSAADHIEVVTMQMDRMLSKDAMIINLVVFNHSPRTLTGPPTAPPGIVSSTLLFGSRP